MRMFIFILVATAFVGLTLPVAGKPAPKRALDENLLTNGDFEDGPKITQQWITFSAGSKHLPGWEIIRGDVDIVEDSFWTPAEGKRSLDLNGLEPGAIRQSFLTEKNKKYRVQFLISCTPRTTERKVKVAVGKESHIFTVDGTNNGYKEMNWTRVSWDFIATDEKSVLDISSETKNSGAVGPAIDDVTVRRLKS